MAVEGVRRSARVRNPVKTYAAQQEDVGAIASAPKRKKPVAATDDAVNDMAIQAPARKRKTKASSVDADSDAAFEAEGIEVVKKPTKKGKRSDDPLPLDQQ
ncbi:hypothetical protein LTR53_020198, partial [Teratosphaeriaceae sp. CCFEE 6253]